MIPIPNALDLVRVAVYAALAPLAGSYNGHPKCYWLAAEQNAPLALLVFQPQAPGARAGFLLNGDWEGLIAVKGLAASPSAAETLLSGAPAAMEGLSAASGYSIVLLDANPGPPFVLDNVWTASQIYRIGLYRN